MTFGNPQVNTNSVSPGSPRTNLTDKKKTPSDNSVSALAISCLPNSPTLEKCAPIFGKRETGTTSPTPSSTTSQLKTTIVANQTIKTAVIDSSIEQLNYDERRIEFRISENDRTTFGMKHLNLVKISKLIHTLGIPDVYVPKPLNITTDQILAFLNKYYTLSREWEALGALKNSHEGTTPFINLPNVQNELSLITESITILFDDTAKNNQLYKELGISPEIETFLEKMRNEQKKIMLRSSGPEDGKHANAGGNLSTILLPDRASFCRDLGKVICSYFSVESLQNRLNDGENPFASPLRLAVIVQELIGETDSHIPVSAVLFSDVKPYTDGQFRLMRISATYGHGYAVVGNEGIATDTALITPSLGILDTLNIRYNNQEKHDRLVPINTPTGIKVQKNDNPHALVSKPALCNTLISRLYHLAIQIEESFGTPVDMEIVIRPGMRNAEGKVIDEIHIVQARELNHFPISASILDSRKIKGKLANNSLLSNPILETIEAETIVLGAGSTLIIDNPDQIVVAEDLFAAQRLYQFGVHKLVISLSQEKSENSHPVVNFTKLGVSCLYVSNSADAKRLLENIDESRPLVVCMGEATLNHWDNQVADAKDYISKGFATHPAKIGNSMDVPHIQKGNTVPLPQNIKDYLTAIRRTNIQKHACELLNKLSHYSWVHQANTAKSELKALYRHLKWIPSDVKDTIKVFDILQTCVRRAFSNLADVLVLSFNNKLQVLYHVKVLETLLSAPQNIGLGVSQYSVSDVPYLSQEATNLIHYQEKLRHPAYFPEMAVLSTEIMTAAGRDDWMNFLLQLEAEQHNIHRVISASLTQAEIDRFKTILSQLHKTRALPFWFAMNFKFNPNIPSSCTTTVQGLLKDFPPNSDGFLNHLEKISEKLKTINAKIDRFAAPHFPNPAWTELHEIINEWTSADSDVIQQFKAGSRSLKILASHTMEEMINTYDLALKELDKSQKFDPPVAKVKIFIEMLKPFVKVLKTCYRELITRDNLSDHHSNLRFIEKIVTSLSKLPTNSLEQLLPTRDFDGSVAILGTYAIRDDVDLSRAVHIHTITHQNLLALVALINTQLITSEDLERAYLPESFKQIIQGVQTSGMQKFRLGFNLTKKSASARYNMPIANHSGQLEVHYDRNSDKLSLKISYYGGEPYRWRLIEHCALRLNHPNMFPLEGRIQSSETGTTFSWTVSPENIQWALNLHDEMSRVTYTSTYITKGPLMFSKVYRTAVDHGHGLAIRLNFLLHPTQDIKQPYDDFLIQVSENKVDLKQLNPIHLVTAICNSQDEILKTYWMNLCTNNEHRLEQLSQLDKKQIRIINFLTTQTKVSQVELLTTTARWSDDATILNDLISQKVGLKQLKNLAFEFLDNPMTRTMANKGGEIFSRLFANELIDKHELFKIGAKLMNAPNLMVNDEGFKLFKLLFSKQLMAAEAIQLIKSDYQDNSQVAQGLGFRVLTALIKQNLWMNTPDGQQVVIDTILSPNLYIKSEMGYLFWDLHDHSHNISFAIKATEDAYWECIGHPDRNAFWGNSTLDGLIRSLPDLITVMTKQKGIVPIVIELTDKNELKDD